MYGIKQRVEIINKKSEWDKRKGRMEKNKCLMKADEGREKKEEGEATERPTITHFFCDSASSVHNHKRHRGFNDRISTE